MKILVLLRGWRRSPGGTLDVEKIGPYERLALGTALALKQAHQGDATVLAMAAGEDQEDEALAVAHGLGVEQTYRIWAPILSEIDALGVAQALACGAKHTGFDLVLAGFRSPDHAQGFIGPAVADFLDVPHLTGVSGLRWDDEQLTADRSCEGRTFQHRLELPCLVTLIDGADPGSAKPAPDYQPDLLTLDDVGLEETRLRPRISLQGKTAPREHQGYVTAFVDDAATVVEHLREVDALLI